MYFRFQIKPVAGEPKRETDGTFQRFTGLSEFFRANDVIGSSAVMRNGQSIRKFKTGIELADVSSNALISTSQKENYKKQIESYRPILEEFYGNEELDSTNKLFWESPDIGRLKISSLDLNKYYDTKEPRHALLYFNIMGGGFIDVVAPSKDYAEQFRIPFYIETEQEFVSPDGESYLTKAEAFSLLSELAHSSDNQALLFLGWVLHSDSKGFGAYTYSTPKSELFKMHGEFIEGKLSFSKKRNTPVKFAEAAKDWKDGKTGRPRIMTEAYFKAAQIYSYINTDKEGRYSLPSGLQLGFDAETAVDTLLKPKNSKEYEDLRTFIEKKWSE